MPTERVTREEILSQPQAWMEALQVLGAHRRMIPEIAPVEQYGQILFTGCGSTYYLSDAAAASTQELTGRPCRAFPASELWLDPGTAYARHTDIAAKKILLVALSRSGETTETLRACEAFLADRRGDLLTLSCYEDMPLAGMGRFNLVFPSGQEQSVAQTRAFSTLYLATVALACLWADKPHLYDSLARLPEAAGRLIQHYASLAADLGRDPDFDRFYWLGSGPRKGLASELSLKMKEMSLSHSEAFHFLEFRHGPKSMLTPSSLIIGLCSTTNRSHETAVLEEVKCKGGKVLDIAEADAQVQFGAGLEETIQNVLYLPVGQLIALERSLAKGLNPDRPMNLESVVRLS